MVKFTITVSNGYITERADANNFGKGSENVIKNIMDLLSFSSIERDIKDKDSVEYIIDSKSFDNSDDFNTKKLSLFNSCVSMLASLALMIKVEEVTK